MRALLIRAGRLRVSLKEEEGARDVTDTSRIYFVPYHVMRNDELSN